MTGSVPVELLQRFLQATPEQQAAMAQILGWPGEAVNGQTSEVRGQQLEEAVWKQVMDMMEKIHHELAAVRREFREMKTVKERLEQMQGEKLFAFVNGIDPDSFRVLCSVLAHGDVAKASRALNLSDSTLRSRMADWPKRGPAYQVLSELVRWRKEIGRKGTVPLNEAITKGTAATTDFVGLLSDVLEELLAMDEENWEEKANALAALLRPYVVR